MKILISGSLAYDRLMTFRGRFGDHLLPDQLHRINVCFMSDGLVERFGGTAGNIAFTLALLGETPVILAAAGRDFDGYEARLRGLGLSLEGIRRLDQEFTAAAYITTDLDGNQITAFNASAMNHAAGYSAAGEDPRNTLAIISPGNLGDMLEYSRAFKGLRLPYIFDPGQSITSWSGGDLEEMITGSDILICNDYEMELITQSTNLTKAQILERTKAVITTLGEKGSLVSQFGVETKVPAAQASRVLDPTGAGDAYRAGLIKGLVMGWDLVEAAKMGATAASFCVEFMGTQEHHFTLEEFWTRHKKNFG
ncbi:MAG: carbohydrate kinase family protein [Pseudomonadota bacterium]